MKKFTARTGRRRGELPDKQLTIGLDVGDRSSFYGVLNGKGEVVLEAKVATRPEALKEAFGRMPRSRIALETGTHSPWMSRLLSELGHEAIVAHARDVRLIGESRRKDDKIDAQTLARLARIDPQLLSPIQHRSAEAQADLSVIRALCAGAGKNWADLCGQRADQIVRGTDRRLQREDLQARHGRNAEPATSGRTRTHVDSTGNNH